MSIDYPNRAEWLAKRANPVAGTRVYVGKVCNQGTYSPGRTQAKTRLWERRQAVKKARRLAKRAKS